MQTNFSQHAHKVSLLQAQVQALYEQKKPIEKRYKGHSNTTRSKTFSGNKHILNCGHLDQIIAIDPVHQQITVEPRVTMEKLVQATLPLGFIPPVIPEFKGITVGGAIMGAAAESSSHRWGIFHDTCTRLHVLTGDGTLIRACPQTHPDLFYGLSGSYGSLGLLVSAEIQLVPIKQTVELTYSVFQSYQDALVHMQALIGTCAFLDGIILAADLAVIIAGDLTDAKPDTFSSMWYAERIQQKAKKRDSTFIEKMALFDYLFRYDQGAFWMGSFLCRPLFLARYIGQGLLNRKKAYHKGFSEREIDLFKSIRYPRALTRFLTKQLMTSQRLFGFLHAAENWVQERLCIQDFCIPCEHIVTFVQDAMQNPGIFPLWLCPIKGTQTEQIFAPHQNVDMLINVGIYGCPSIAKPMADIVGFLEKSTSALSGRKVFYSTSYYDEASFWNIYPKATYTHLRKKTQATDVWPEITEKVL